MKTLQRIYNPKATEWPPSDKVYDEFYQYCIDKNMQFRIDYMPIPSRSWGMKNKYMERVKCFMMWLDKEDILMLKLSYGEKIEIKSIF